MTIGIETIRARIAYDPETGAFSRMVASGNAPAGSSPLSTNRNGYVYVSVLGQKILAHRVAWALVHNEWPEDDIDHVNGVRSDNRLTNLRKATRGQNMQNERRARSSNKSSGLLGVSWSKAASKWAASIKVARKKIHLGLFDCEQEAHQRYIEAKRELHPFSTL